MSHIKDYQPIVKETLSTLVKLLSSPKTQTRALDIHHYTSQSTPSNTCLFEVRIVKVGCGRGSQNNCKYLRMGQTHVKKLMLCPFSRKKIVF